MELLAEPTAFLSISQTKSLYSHKGVQGRERQWERPSLENTVNVTIAARKADANFFWIGYDVFRENYPKTPFDEVQYRLWHEP